MKTFEDAAMALTTPLLRDHDGAQRITLARRAQAGGNDDAATSVWNALSSGERAYLTACHHAEEMVARLGDFDANLRATLLAAVPGT